MASFNFVEDTGDCGCYNDSIYGGTVMRITEIQLKDFRNYTSLSLLPGEGINLLMGQNAQGKTNLLEGV